MIATQKKQLSKKLSESHTLGQPLSNSTCRRGQPPFIQLTLLFITLIVFFIYATFFNQPFFVFITIGMLGCLFYLVPLRYHLVMKGAEAQLQVQDCHERTNLTHSETHQEGEVIEAFRKKIVSYSKLKVLTEELSLCLTLDDTSKTLSSEANKLLGGRETTIILYLFHSKTGVLGISSSRKGQLRVNIKSKKGDLFDQWLVKSMQPLLVEDTKSDYRFDIDKIVTEDARGIRSLISAPLMVGNKALGILRIDSPKEDYFTTEDLRFLATIGDLGAVAIENAQLYERVEQLAIKDGLTHLYLRRYLMERMPKEMSRQLRCNSQMSFFMMDIDKFKRYNDTFGHMAGDIVLRTVGILLMDFFKQPGSLVCRYGGEEFAVMIPDCPKDKAVELAEKIRQKISKQTVLLRREKTQVTISVGIATFPKDAQMKEDLIHKADMALYKAKNEGRNRVCVA